jgi:hypothetical protein
MKNNRRASVIIKEAELLSASNDFVYQYYQNLISEKSISIYNVDIDAETESKLLSRNEAFIDITLAKNCIYEDTLFELFSKSTEQNNRALRLACLSNIGIGFIQSTDFNSPPHSLFNKSVPRLNNWLITATSVELGVLFENETISTGFLKDFLNAKNQFWYPNDELAEDKIFTVLYALSRNKSINNRSGNESSLSEDFRYFGIELALWDLTKFLPVTIPMGNALADILEVLETDSVPYETVAPRWSISNGNAGNTRTKTSLDGCERVRFALYRKDIDIFAKDESLQALLENEDIAFRACAYENLLHLTVDHIALAYKKDGELAVNYFLGNLRIWENFDLRCALRTAVDQCDGSFYYKFNIKHERLKLAYPDIFEDQDKKELLVIEEELSNKFVYESLRREFDENQALLLTALANEIRAGKYTILACIFAVALAYFSLGICEI